MGVDAALAAGEGGAALIHIGTRPAIVLQAEAGAAAALQAQGALGWGRGLSRGLPPWSLELQFPPPQGCWLALLRKPSLEGQEAGSKQILSNLALTPAKPLQ